MPPHALRTISSRAVIGMFYEELESNVLAWPNQIGMRFQSDQASETYPWLGNVPMLRQWKGRRQAKELAEFGITIPNLDFEATTRFHVHDLDRDKTGQIRIRIGDLAARANQHWGSLLSTLILAAESQVCYDGQFFFDIDHVEGDSGTQSNDLTFDATTATAPTVAEFADAVLAAVQAFYGFKDDVGEPINEGARSFIVMVPVPFWGVARQALTLEGIITPSGVKQNPLMAGDLSFELVANPRLTWTTKFSLFRADGRLKPFILQEELDAQMKAVAEGSEHEFFENEHVFGVNASRNVGFGKWQHAVLTTFT